MITQMVKLNFLGIIRVGSNKCSGMRCGREQVRDRSDNAPP